MSRIKGKNTSVEVAVRKYLFSKGFRYKKNVKDLPGKPDIVLPKYQTAVFIHGCFWHQHSGCKRATIPKSRLDYWGPKLDKNVENDKKNMAELQNLGWKVIVVWECELKKKSQFEITMEGLKNQIQQ